MLSKRMKWLLEALIEEDEEEQISIEYILMKAELEFNEKIQNAQERLKDALIRLCEYELPYEIKHFADQKQVSGFNKGVNKSVKFLNDEIDKIFKECFSKLTQNDIKEEGK